MNIKNYTSDVPVGTTISRIQNFLIAAKVNGISMEYRPTGAIEALLFHVDLDRRYSIRMTANVDAVHETFWRERVAGRRTTKLVKGDECIAHPNGVKTLKSDLREQAERTAWKLQQDWVEVQMSLLRLQKIDFLQVFMPYLWDGKQTFYERIKGSGMLALTEGSK